MKLENETIGAHFFVNILHIAPPSPPHFILFISTYSHHGFSVRLSLDTNTQTNTNNTNKQNTHKKHDHQPQITNIRAMWTQHRMLIGLDGLMSKPPWTNHENTLCPHFVRWVNGWWCCWRARPCLCATWYDSAAELSPANMILLPMIQA